MSSSVKTFTYYVIYSYSMYTIGWDILAIFVARTNPTPGEGKSKVGTSALRSSMLDTLILTVAVYALAEQTLLDL